MPPVLPSERIAHLGTAGACCTAGSQPCLCPLWVISGQSVILEPCPLYPQKRTNRRRLDLSALCQKRTNAPQQNFLFDHRAERSGAHRTKNRRLCGARAKPPAEVAGPRCRNGPCTERAVKVAVPPIDDETGSRR